MGATVVAASLLAREVHRQFRGFVLSIAAALLPLGAIAAGFPVTGGWYDATMPDPLALALSIVSACAIAENPRNLGRGRAAFVASVMVLTVYTKQSYIILVAWQILFLVRANVRQGLMVGVATAG